MDDKTKLKQDQLIIMASKFCDEEIDAEYKELCVKLIEKMGRKREVPFRRGKLEIWASGIIYVIGQLNFLFDDSFSPYLTPDDICNYFGTKKSTTSTKARDIRKILNLKLGDEEFSTKLIKDSNLSGLGGDLSQIKTLKGAQTSSILQGISDNIVKIMKKR